MTSWLCLTLTTTTIREDFYKMLAILDLQANAFVSTQILIVLWDVVPKSIIICIDILKYAKNIFTTLEVKITILPLDMQNYHFALRGDFLGLTSKSYYGFVLMWILWLHNLFHNLTTIYT